MISPFGEYLREIRNRSNESLRSLAKRLNVSPAFLSMMEVGRKLIPLEYCEKISELYNLNNEEKQKLLDSINITNGNVDLEIKKMNDAQKEVSLLFARKIVNADPELVEKLKAVLEEKKDDSN